MLLQSYKLTSGLAAYAEVIGSSRCLVQTEKTDLLELCREFAELLETPAEMAARHLALTRDIEVASAQAQYLRDEQSLECDRVYGQEYANARHTARVEDGRITEEHLKNAVASSRLYIDARHRLHDREKVLGVLLGLKKNLYARAEMIKVMAVKDREF